MDFTTRIQDLFAAFIVGGVCVALLIRFVVRWVMRNEVVTETKATEQGRQEDSTESKTSYPRVMAKQA